MGYRVYRYGCRAPTAGAEAAIEQMRLRVRLWNALVELEHRYRADVEAVLAELAPGTEAAARPVAEADAAVTAERSAAYRAARRAAFRREDVRARLADLEAARREAVKAAQAAHAAEGLWWGNYDDVIRSYTVARTRPGGELRFHAWHRARGKVSVRYQTGLPLAAAYAERDTRFQLRPLPAGTWDTRRGRRLARTVARVRVGSDGRAPRWLELPLVQHRPIPAGSVIRQVAVTRDLIAGTPRWALLVVVDEPEPPLRVVPRGPVVAVNLGWRARPDGSLRVAVWTDSHGHTGELTLAPAWRDQLAKTEAIRSQRDINSNLARNELLAWLAAARREGRPELPDWLTEAARTLAAWREPDRLSRLVRRWADARFAGDEAIYPALAAWRARERHLHQYEANVRDTLLAQRLDRYRKCAAGLVRGAGQVRLHELELARIARRGPDGLADDLVPAARAGRHEAALSILRQAIVQAAAAAGVAVVTLPAGERITQRCAACRSDQRFDAAEHVEWTCTVCGQRWDQDYNATRNMLAWTPPQADAPGESEGSLRGDAGEGEVSAG